MPSLSMSPLSVFLWALFLRVGQTRNIVRSNYRTQEDFVNDAQVTAKPHILESAGLFQGDIAGIPNATAYLEQYNDAMNQSLKADRHGNAIKSPYAKWPNGIIPYIIDKNVTTTTRNAVASAMKEIQERTCIKFVQRSNERDYVNIVTGNGCTSNAGDIHMGAQILSLGDGCGFHYIAVHELMHSIGFFHEQSRNDRDDYVNIWWGNVKDGMGSPFIKMELDVITHLGTPYEYGSVMHYDNRAFGKDNKITIEAKGQPSLQLGNNIGLSKNDALKINLLYECKGKDIGSGNVISPTSKSQCVDQEVTWNCPAWARDGCSTSIIKIGCRKSCNLC